MYSSSSNSNRLSSTSRSGGGSAAFAPLSISTSAAAASEAEALDRRASTNTASVDGRPPLLVQGTLIQSQSQQQHSQQQQSSSYTYYRGGFSTSLCDLFHDPRDRASCCALTCCGTFLQDRNRYVLTGELPPPWWMRIVGYLGGFIVSVVIGAVSGIPVLAIVLPVVFCVVMMIRATALRQQVRWLLIQKMAQTRPHNQHGEGEPAYASMRSEHWCCAIVSNDKRRYIHLPSTTTHNNNNARHSLEYDADSNFDNNPHAHSNIQRELEYTQHLERQQRRQQADFCFRLWQCLAWTCCDACCFSWCQCCGMCAIGQEDRELRRLLPPQVFLRDYITFQPYGEYYPPIEWLRQEQQQQQQLDDNDMPTTTTRSTGSLFWKHLGTLSVLSQKLLHMLVASLALLLVASILHLIANFSIAKVVVILATLAQAFLILYLVYWRHHRNDISLDAIIKFFASGFVLAMMAALVVELILDLMGEIVFSIVMTNEYIDDHPEMTFDDDRTTNHGGPFANMDTFKTMAKSHYLTLLAYLFFKAVIVAALVEELTKYYCFWMVEHPDFIYASTSTSSSLSTGSSLALSEWNNESNSSLGEEGAFCNSVTAATAAATSQGGVTPPMSPSEAATTNLPPFRPRKAPSHTTAGAMITVGMIATAAGFSCSENLMYVFSQNSVAGEISVLVARSALPVHSICAAIQSIGVARRDVEQDADYKIGWAILPAVMLHGIFDFALLALAFFEYIFSDTTPQPAKYTSAPITTNNDDWKGLVDDDQYAGGAYQDVPAATLGQQLLSFGVGAAITMVGVLYYVNEAGKQRGRLQALELTTAEVPSTAGMVFA